MAYEKQITEEQYNVCNVGGASKVYNLCTALFIKQTKEEQNLRIKKMKSNTIKTLFFEKIAIQQNSPNQFISFLMDLLIHNLVSLTQKQLLLLFYASQRAILSLYQSMTFTGGVLFGTKSEFEIYDKTVQYKLVSSFYLLNKYFLYHIQCLGS